MSLLEIARRWDGVAELERDGTAEKLRAVAITPEENVRLRAEAAAGDHLAEIITAVLATTEGR